MTTGSLTTADLERHLALGIPATLLARAGVRRVTDAEARELLANHGRNSARLDGIEYPYIDPESGYRVTSRVRLDHPPVRADGRPDGKYRSGSGDRRHLYFPPDSGALLTDRSVPVAVVESEKAALAGTAFAERTGRRLLFLGTGGCWGWKGSIGKDIDPHGVRVDVRGASVDFSRIAWMNREALIIFDARPNASVTEARRVLAHELEGRGARVRHVHLPNDDLAINGPDDFIGCRGDSATAALLDAAIDHDFDRNEKGFIVRESLDNIRRAFQLSKTVLTFDSFSQQILIGGAPFDDVRLDQLWIEIDDRFRFRPSKDVLTSVVVTEAHRRAYHPVRNYLDGLAWDGTERLDKWLVTYGRADNESTYVSAVGTLTLTAAVRRVRQPGCKFDELLILESDQGTWKSSALRALCPREDWFSDDLPLGVDAKQIIERTAGRWIIEAAELYGHRGREAEALKAFLSRQVDGPVRLAYARLPIAIPRQFILIGTTNTSAHYLKDGTGARRFWPVRVNGFDIAELIRDRDQLWAEAAAREANGDSIRLDADLWSAAREEQDQRTAVDPWEDLIEPVTQDGDAVKAEVTAAEIWNALGLEGNRRSNRDADRVASIMQRLGYTKERRYLDDTNGRRKQARCWAKPVSDDE